MQIKDIQQLINNKLEPNVAEWTYDVEDIFEELDMFTPEIKRLLTDIRGCNASWHKSFPEKSDSIVALLKRAIKKIEKSSNNNIHGESIIMTKENVFIVYSLKHSDIMREIKEFVREELGFEPKTLDISEFTGSVWNAFSEKSQDCQKAIIVMAEDDRVVSDDSEYMQARPNVFIELGYMIHKCGLNNVTIVCSENCKSHPILVD